MSEPRPRVLLTNDDGVRAPGLAAAYAALAEVADVTVVAPSEQRSGVSHSITLEVPLRATPLERYPGYRVDFTPVDSVKLALKHLLPQPPDVVVSGINRGQNAGFLAHYSGTVAAAKEAALSGHQALAISLCTLKDPDFEPAAALLPALVRLLVERPLPPGVLLNVNVPALPTRELRGFRWCRQSLRVLDDDYERRSDPRERPYYWLTGAGPLEGLDPADDLTAIQEGYVALTPLVLDWTHPALFADGGDEALDALRGALGPG